MHRSTRLALAMLLVALSLAHPLLAGAQLVNFDEELYVTVLRQDKLKIGVAPRRGTAARQWVRLEGRTQVFHRNGRASTQAAMWKALKPGMRIR